MIIFSTGTECVLFEVLGLCAAAGLIQWLNHMAMTGAAVMRGHELEDLTASEYNRP